jgi:hypothetical protein
MEQRLVQLLLELHQSIDRVARDLSRDRPDLAQALRREAAWIPRPEEILSRPVSTPARECARIRPLLYNALDSGIIDARRFDQMMLRQVQAAKILSERK